MARSNTGQSTTVSDGVLRSTDTDTDGGSKEVAAVDLQSVPDDGSPYQVGEKVLARHKQHFYPAKVQKIECRMNELSYFVHYIGWKKKWDEWVQIERLMKFEEGTDEKKQPESKNEEIENSRRPSVYTKRKQSAAPRGRKRSTSSVSKDKSPIPMEKLLNIQVPPSLKKQLLDDCEFVTHLGKLVELPRTPSVDEILKKYSAYRAKKDGTLAESVGEILNGIRCYFDKSLPAMLLYKSERKQYEEAITDQVSPSSVYGAEHLLRLFVKLPEILYYAGIEEESLAKLQTRLQDLLKFLQKNQSTFFLATYHAQGQSCERGIGGN